MPEQHRKSVSAQGGAGGRSKETDKVAWKCLNDPVRDNCLGMIYDGLCFEAAQDIGKYLHKPTGRKCKSWPK